MFEIQSKNKIFKMKIAISSKYTDGPFGGGNLFIKNLENFLLSKIIRLDMI